MYGPCGRRVDSQLFTANGNLKMWGKLKSFVPLAAREGGWDGMVRGTVNTETRLELTVGGPAGAGARLAGSFSGWWPGSQWKARPAVACASTLGRMVCQYLILLGDLNFIP